MFRNFRCVSTIVGLESAVSEKTVSGALGSLGELLHRHAAKGLFSLAPEPVRGENLENCDLAQLLLGRRRLGLEHMLVHRVRARTVAPVLIPAVMCPSRATHTSAGVR